MSQRRYWTEAEDSVIHQYYAGQGASGVLAHLPHRTVRAIWMRANAIGVKKSPRWTPEEDEQLVVLWGVLPMKTIAKRIGRTNLAIWLRARELSLKVARPEGWESLREVERRTGYCCDTMKRILKWAAVPMAMSYSYHNRRKGRYRLHIVRTADVDRAVALWLETETINSAAQRRGMLPETLRSRLVDFGIKPKVRNKSWRVPTKDIDAAIASWAEHTTLKDAARSIGVCTETFTKWAKAAGFATGHGIRIKKTDVAVIVQRRSPKSRKQHVSISNTA